jgi:hypothetical protein
VRGQAELSYAASDSKEGQVIEAADVYVLSTRDVQQFGYNVSVADVVRRRYFVAASGRASDEAIAQMGFRTCLLHALIFDHQGKIAIVNQTKSMAAIVEAHRMRINVLRVGQMHAKAQVVIAVMIEAETVPGIGLYCCDGHAVLMVIEQPDRVRR